MRVVSTIAKRGGKMKWKKQPWSESGGGRKKELRGSGGRMMSPGLGYNQAGSEWPSGRMVDEKGGYSFFSLEPPPSPPLSPSSYFSSHLAAPTFRDFRAWKYPLTRKCESSGLCFSKNIYTRRIKRIKPGFSLFPVPHRTPPPSSRLSLNRGSFCLRIINKNVFTLKSSLRQFFLFSTLFPFVTQEKEMCTLPPCNLLSFSLF